MCIWKCLCLHIFYTPKCYHVSLWRLVCYGLELMRPGSWVAFQHVSVSLPWKKPPVQEPNWNLMVICALKWGCEKLYSATFYMLYHFFSWVSGMWLIRLHFVILCFIGNIYYNCLSQIKMWHRQERITELYVFCILQQAYRIKPYSHSVNCHRAMNLTINNSYYTRKISSLMSTFPFLSCQTSY